MPKYDAVYLAEVVSWLCGWIYFLSWSISFYPQPLLNIRRRSTVGSALDFSVINVLGFLLYLISTSFLYWSPTVRAQFAERHPSTPEPGVRFNDVAFAGHAVLLSALTASMFVKSIWGFQQRKNQAVSMGIIGVGIGSVLSLLAMVVLVLGWGDGTAQTWAWIDVIRTMGWAKIFITTVKCIPQAILNYRRKSTVGWNIMQVLLDLSGGIFSVAQLLIDSALQGDWTGFTANPIKFWLGNLSIVFDAIFIYQHYFLYRRAATEVEESRGLLAPEAIG